MASNFFGQIFRITTFGESHGAGIGVVIDGCPAGLELSLQDIQTALDKRRPGAPNTSPRKEPDQAEILSGLFEGKTTGAPIAIFIRNKDAESSPYDAIKDLYRPGHANFTWLEKYGLFDHRGGGRASARETAARVAAGSVAKKLLATFNIHSSATLIEMGGCSGAAMWQALEVAKAEGDSLGGIVSCSIQLPAGLGDPIYCKLEAMLASAMLSLPASKGFEIGSGFAAAKMKGSEHNDAFEVKEGKVHPATNSAGGTLGGISTGEELTFRVAFKPTASIKKPQATATVSGEKATLQLPEGMRHDPCVAIRAVPVVEAMADLVLADALLLGRSARLSSSREPGACPSRLT